MVHLSRKTGCCVSCLAGYTTHHWNGPEKGNNHLSHLGVGTRLDLKVKEQCGTNTLAKRGAHLQERSALSSSPLSEELQCLLGLVTYTSGKQEELAFEPLVAESPYREGRAPIPEDAWYTDSSSCGQPPMWAIAFHPKTETIWMEDGEGKSSL